jgi:hypothetical protein
MKLYVWYVPKYNKLFIDTKNGFESKDEYGIYKFNCMDKCNEYLIGEV